jgi:FkbM family methyltransferase
MTGVEVTAFQGSFAQHRSRRLRETGVRSFLDVGAHVGAYALALRRQGFAGHIVSFEPSEASLPMLRSRASRDGQWSVVDAAIGASSSPVVLNLSENQQSSSLLPILVRHIQSAPESRYTGSQQVTLTTLDDVVDAMSLAPPLALKVDTQGYELEVLRGAESVIEQMTLVELEMSLVPLYAGGAMYDDVLTKMRECGFRLCDLQRAHVDPSTRELLQFNGMFCRGTSKP